MALGLYRYLYRLAFSFAGALILVCSALAAAPPLSVAQEHETAIGLLTQHLEESAGRLELPDVIAAQRAGKFAPGESPVLNFGIGAKPVWIHFAVDNRAAAPVQKRLSIDNAWLDHIEVHFRNPDGTVVSHRAGDRQAFMQRPVASRYFVFDHAFGTGVSDVYLRVETPDPLVVPAYLLNPEVFRTRQAQQELGYGVVYGFLLALLAYNAILFASLRSSRYLAYAIYLAMFLAMNIAYTGHGFAWLWPASPHWQQWSNPILMFLYGVSGLAFAIRFLDLSIYFPRVYKAVVAYCAAFGTLIAAGILLDNQEVVLQLAFTFAFLFTGIMLLLGVISVRVGQKAAKYFLIAAITAMVGALLTTLSVWGFIPFNAWTFHAVEIGMLADATLLALALAYQFRVGQEDRLRAEKLAQLDPLTGLNNRRAFYDKTSPLWSQAIRHEHVSSIMLLDIDRFKQINDDHGHAHGDEVLKDVARILRASIRDEDILARWGGEEFIVFLPETGQQEGMALAERLRVAIEGMRIPGEAGETTVTASFGIAESESEHYTLDALIASADECLYQAKQQGRNRVAGCATSRTAVAG